MTKFLFRTLISIGIAAIAIWWLNNQGFEVLPPWSAIEQTIFWWTIPCYTVLFSLFHLLRAWRWNYLLKPFASVSTGTMLQVAFAGFTAIQMMPLRTGEIARPYLLDRYAGVSKSALFGTIAIERVIDGLLVSLWLTAALFGATTTRAAYIWGAVPLGIFVAALVLLIAFNRRPEFVRKLIGQVVGLASTRLADFVVGVLERFHIGLAALRGKSSLSAFVVVSIVYWGINAVSFYLLAVGCSLGLPLVGAVAGMGCLAVGILLPAGPGYFGNFQVAVLAALEMYLSPDVAAGQAAAVFIFMLYILQTGLTLLFGIGGAIGLKQRPVVKRGDAAQVD
jgi:uncharacterized protein (TIRG00374 family)